MTHPAVRAYAEALEAAAQARRRRDKAIRAELAKGKSLRQVAAEFDGSAQWVREVRDKAD